MWHRGHPAILRSARRDRVAHACVASARHPCGREGTSMAGTSRHVTFPAAGELSLRLEGVLALPPAAAEGARCPAALLCHPMPVASSMRDPLLVQLESDLVTCGFVTLRFNFRGVGASEGESTDGRLEPLDIAGAISFLLAQSEVNP